MDFIPEDEEIMGLPLGGRVIIVTGASGGIGKLIAIRVAELGAKVVVHYSYSQQMATEVISTIYTNNSSSYGDGVKAISCQADIENPFEVAQLFDIAEQTFGSVHCLVHCAGALRTSVEDLDWTFQVNWKGAFLCSTEAANRIVRGGGGRIINLSSSLVGMSRPGFSTYAASKAAVEMITQILAQGLQGTKITANCVFPGPVANDMFFAGNREPLELAGKLEDVARVVAFLLSDEGEGVNGQVLWANGGLI